MLDLRRLRLLRELAHRGTLHAVATALNYSPSTVSQQLAQLETEVGVPLLEHVGRRVRLTPQAQILVGHTEHILERLEQARADVAASTEGVTGTVRVAAFPTAAYTLLPAALTRLAGEHPRLRVHLTVAEPEQAVPALLARDFDLVVAEEYPGRPRRYDADVAELLSDPIRLALPAGSDPPPARQAWVMEPAGTAARDWAVAECRAAGFEPDVRYESSDLLLHVRLVETGHAAAFLPDLVWGGRPPSVPVRPPSAERRIHTVVRRGQAGHPAIRALRQSLAVIPSRSGRSGSAPARSSASATSS